jgi:hypothetical protein
MEETTETVEHDLVASGNRLTVSPSVLQIAVLYVDAIPQLEMLACLLDDSGGFGQAYYHFIFDKPVAPHH